MADARRGSTALIRNLLSSLRNIPAHGRRIRNFAANYALVETPIWKRHKHQIIRVITADFIGASSVGAMIALVGFYVNSTQREVPTVIPIVDIVIGGNLPSLIFLSIAVILLTGVGACATYYAGLRTRKIGRNAHIFFISELLQRLQTIRQRRLSDENRHDLSSMSRQVLRNAIQLGIATETLIRSLRPIIYCSVATALICKLDFILTVIIAPVGLMIVPIVYVIGSLVIADSRTFFDSSVQEFGREMSGLISSIDGSSFPTRPKRLAEERLNNIDSVSHYLDGYDKFLLADNHMTFALSLFQAMLFGLAIMIFGAYALHEVRAWGTMLAYVIALLYLLNNLKALSANLTTLNRFYPNLLGYLAFHADTNKWVAPDDASTEIEADGIQITVNEPGLDGTLSELQLQPGDRAYLCTPVKPSRLEFDDFVRSLNNSIETHDDLWSISDFVQIRRRFLDGTLADNIIGDDPDPDKRIRVENAFDELGLLPELSLLPAGLDTQLNEKQWALFSDATLAAIRLIPCILGRRPLVFIDIALTRAWSAEQMRKYLEMLPTKIVLIVANGGLALNDSVAEQVIVAFNDRVQGIGNVPWYHSHIDDIAAMMKESDRETGTDDDDSTMALMS